MAEVQDNANSDRCLPHWRQVACPGCPPDDVNLVHAYVPRQTLQEQGAESVIDLSDKQIHRLAATRKAAIPNLCADCIDD